ncbi:MAG: hypothetical protein ACPGF7_00325 [Pontibacterium sp.]
MSVSKIFICFSTLLALLSGCSSMESLVDVPVAPDNARIAPYSINTHQRSVHLFDPVSLKARIRERHLRPRVQQLYVLVDQTFTASDRYRDYSYTDYSREIFRRFNRTLPALPLGGGAYALRQAEDSTEPADMPRYTARVIEQQLNAGRSLPGIGTADLAEAIDAISIKAQISKGNVALVILTDWKRIDQPVHEAVQRFRQRMRAKSGFLVGARHRMFAKAGAMVNPDSQAWKDSEQRTGCVVMLGIGNRLSRTALDEVDQCGFSIAADKVAQPRDMSHLVERVLFNGPEDSDGDGIYDYKDRCPDTTPGRLIRFDGCARFATQDNQGVD